MSRIFLENKDVYIYIFSYVGIISWKGISFLGGLFFSYWVSIAISEASILMGGEGRGGRAGEG